MKRIACFIIVFDILFITFIGSVEKKNQYNSLDQRFKRNMPKLYENLNFIGFRVTDENHVMSNPTKI